MNWNNVRLIFLREVRDQLRDRRTLFMALVLPLLLYPGLAIGMVQFSLLFRDQPRTVVVLGAQNLPAEPPLLQGNRFAENWFPIKEDSDRLHVITDTSPAANEDEDSHAPAAQILAEARELRPLVEQLEARRDEYFAAQAAQDQARMDSLIEPVRELKEKLAERFTATRIQVLIIIPNGLREQIERTTKSLAARNGFPKNAANPPETLRPLVVENSADEKSMFAYQGVKAILAGWEQAILQARLSAARLPSTLSTPVNPAPIDIAVTRQLSANFWSKLFPTLLIIMAVTGAFYPAVDVAAGEKERGTMETLLICPAGRSEIVLGKFFTVLSFSISTVLLNLISMGVTGKYVVGGARAEALAKMGGSALTFPGWWEVLWILVLLLPLAGFYSAVSLALATFARSTKEGQYYLTPLLMVTLGLTLFCVSPVVEIDPFYSILPVIGPALLLKQVLASPGDTAPLVYAIPVLITSIAYSLAGLWWAISMFTREDVLFREAERFDLKLWIRHLLRDKEPTPSGAEAILCFVLMMLLQLVALRFAPTGKIDGAAMLRLLLVQQLVFVGSPAFFMGVMLTTSVVRTFRLRLPSWEYLATACILPLALHPLSIELQTRLQWFFPPLPKRFAEMLANMRDPSIPLWLLIVAVAAAPALCEELVFRGFILSGFLRSSRTAVAVVLSSLAFGLSHMVPQQVFNATLLGLLLGFLAVRSGSIFPGMIFHFTYNALEMLRMRASSKIVELPRVVHWFIKPIPSGEGDIQYNWLTLTLSGLVAAVLIGRLISTGRARARSYAASGVTPRETAGDPVRMS